MDAKSLYQQQSVETAAPAQLVSMLFHGAIARTARGEAHLAAGELEAANGQLQHAQEIVFALRDSLDFERGGEIARNLSSLYAFCVERLIEANASKDPAPLAAVGSTLAELADAWDRMAAGREAAGALAPRTGVAVGRSAVSG